MPQRNAIKIEKQNENKKQTVRKSRVALGEKLKLVAICGGIF